MANNMRWRYGDTNPVVMSVQSGDAIEIGDILYGQSGDARPASTAQDMGDETTNQELLHTTFLGIAMQSSPVGDTSPIRVATTGVFEFNCPTTTYDVGDLMGGSENSAGNALENQKVKNVLAIALAIGRCVKKESSSSGSVHVDIVSTLTRGGPQGIDTSGL